MRALASAMWIAQTRSVPLVLTWRPDHAMTVPFERIFTNRVDQDAAPLAGRPTVVLSEPRSIDFDRGPAAEADVVEIRGCEAFSPTGGPAAYSRSFWSSVRPHLLSLQPVDEVIRRVDEIGAKFGRTTIGVHVRTGEGPVWFEHASRIRVEEVIETVERALVVEGRARIFLATDSKAVEATMIEQFGSIVLTSESHRPLAADPEGAVEALRFGLVDLLLLSRTTFLFGSFFSSFSAMAAILGGIPARRLGGRPGEPGAERDLTFFVETPAWKRAWWRLRSIRHRRS